MIFGFSEPDVPQITAEDVKHALDSGSDVILLDVRTPEEFTRNRIKGAVHIPIDQITQTVESVIPDKNSSVYVYCLSGSRSVHAVEEMQKLGYTRVYNMTSGLLAWRLKKFPVVE